MEPEIATNLAPFRLSPVQGSPFIPQEHSNIHLNSSGSNGLAPPRNPFDPIEGSHIPTVNVPMTAEEASTLIMPKKIYSQPVRAADGGTVWVTRNPFFERFDQDSDQDRRLFYIFDVQANKLPDSDTELIGRVEKALGIGPGVMWVRLSGELGIATANHTAQTQQGDSDVEGIPSPKQHPRSAIQPEDRVRRPRRNEGSHRPERSRLATTNHGTVSQPIAQCCHSTSQH